MKRNRKPSMTIAYIPSSHLDLYWLGTYKTCLKRGAEVIKEYLDRCMEHAEETFLIETAVFAEYFLQRYPRYRNHLKRMVADGQVEVGAAYVDRWETLILGESLIRNVQMGSSWYAQTFGSDNLMITHPDLPSMVPQIAQIYSAAGLKYYVTSRKVFEHGAVWRYRSPDGSTLTVLSYPRHYVFTVMDDDDVPPDLRETMWMPSLDMEQTSRGFPQKTIPVSGSAGDLTGRETFRRRYGRNLEEFVTLYRERYRDLDFVYSLPSRILGDYDDGAVLPTLSGEIPSVWGVAADEEAAFFRRDRSLESALLTAETLVAMAGRLGLTWLPESADSWQGPFYEAAFFGPKDPIRPGRELAELWRMHVFTQDHNGGGQEGAMSTFHKRTIQERCRRYTDEIISHTLDRIGERLETEGEGLLVANPHGQPWSGPVILPTDTWSRRAPSGDPTTPSLSAQRIDEKRTAVWVDEVPPVGYRFYAAQSRSRDGGRVTHREGNAGPHPVRVARDTEALHIDGDRLGVTLDLVTGAVTRIHDYERAQEWGGSHIGRLSTIEECGNDVTLRIAPDAAVEDDEMEAVSEVERGPLFVQVRVSKRLARHRVEQCVRFWLPEPRIDLETRLFWWGERNRQVRLRLPSIATAKNITYGSPFYGVGWTETADGAAPRNRDEIEVADYPRYREVQRWLHLSGETGGLIITTPHPGFFYDDRHLAAVLLRSPASCGDARLFWENAGAQSYTFTFRPTERSWTAADAQRRAAFDERSPACRRVSPGAGHLPTEESLLSIDGALLSALQPADHPGVATVRFSETSGRASRVTMHGPMARGHAVAVDLRGVETHPLARHSDGWVLDVPPWAIRTVALRER